MASNRRGKRLIGLLFVLLIWGASAVLAAVPAAINYQGRFEDLSGPVDGSLDLTFRLFDADVAGTIVWEEANSVLVNQGVYNVILGTGTLNSSYGSLEEAIFENDDLWLEVQVAGEADAMAPRQKLTSVGFALRAGSVSDGAITTTMLATDAIATEKLVDGAVTAAKMTGGFVPNLDADRLDGLDSASFAPSVHNHDGQYYSKTYVDVLEGRIAALEAKLQYLAVVAGIVNGMPGPHMMITGANLHVRSGSGSTSGTVNGVGNLIVGYNELRAANNDRSGSHNIVTGRRHNYSSFGGLVAGHFNTISANYASVSGGIYNTASGDNASVSGGNFNTANGYNSSVSGGSGNMASAINSSASGGKNNIASGDYSFVGGGGGDQTEEGNQAFGHYSAILGGTSNIAGNNINANDHSIGQHATVSGGDLNKASGSHSHVSGGQFNIASGDYSFVGGGGGYNEDYSNVAFSNYSAILGGKQNTAGDDSDPSNHSTGERATIGGGSYNRAKGHSSSISGGENNQASGHHASVSGGYANQASGNNASVSGGESNTASGYYASVSGGESNTASDSFSSVSGGLNNEASGYYSSVSAGRDNIASGYYSFVGGGISNEASGVDASIGGGYSNSASGDNASVSGGINNEASGARSSVSGGSGNTASADYSSVSGGWDNTASGAHSSVTGGYYNEASGNAASVSGGYNNEASGSSASVSGGSNDDATGSFNWRAGDCYFCSD